MYHNLFKMESKKTNNLYIFIDDFVNSFNNNNSNQLAEFYETITDICK